MDKKRILKEAQKIASNFSFWMVSGDIAHLYGHVYETPEKKYEIEIKFEENFPNSPPQLIYHDEVKKLLGDFQLTKLIDWNPESTVVDVIHELKLKIQKALQELRIIDEKQLVPKTNTINDNIQAQTEEEYITPDLDAYPTDFEIKNNIKSTDNGRDLFYNDQTITNSPEIYKPASSDELNTTFNENVMAESEHVSIAISTELGLIQQEYAYDQITQNIADINVYITITLTKTFIIQINFANYPERPKIIYPKEINEILGTPFDSLDLLKKWDVKKPPHIVSILHELEKKLFFVKDIEIELKKIQGEYQYDIIANSMTKLKVHLLTYGFKEYIMEVDLSSYPKPPIIKLSSDLEKIIRLKVPDLKIIKNWREKDSEPIEIIRELSWLVDKNSRISFEIELLKEHYKDMNYDPQMATLNINMKGKMKTQDITFKFQINLPLEYPMSMPEIKVLNEFELETHEKIKNDLQTSFQDFFNEWTPFSYLIDLFNLISNKIFEVSVISCVICHKIECPTCNNKIADTNESKSCYVSCPYCERAYHKHCWDQTIKSFGKCGFCLKTPPPNMMP